MNTPTTPAPDEAAPPAPETHSPLPWRVVSEAHDYGDQVIRDARDYEVLAMGPSAQEGLDATLIVRSVNALPILVQQLRACAARFREYADTHNAKGAPDKAARNQVMAAECEKAIALAEATP